MDVSNACLCKRNFYYKDRRIDSNEAAIETIQDPNVRKLASVLFNARTFDLTDVQQNLIPDFGDILDYGARYEDSFVSCSFEMMPCDYWNFTTLYDANYGKCFIFNYVSDSKSLESPLYSDFYGSESGLEIVLQAEINQHEGNFFMRDVGYRVVVHDPQKLPLIAEDGFDVTDTVTMDLQVSVEDYWWLSPPWGTCVLHPNNVSNAEYVREPYDQLTCFKMCCMMEVLQHCKCLSKIFGLGHLNTENFMATGAVPCSESNGSHATCINNVLISMENEEINCDCASTCYERKYIITAVNSVTNDAFYSDIMFTKGLRLHDGKLATMNSSPRSMSYIVIKVYFKTRELTNVTDVSIYSWETLVANIGGSMGFFMGLTLVMFVELAEFLLEMTCSFFKRRRRSRKTSDHFWKPSSSSVM